MSGKVLDPSLVSKIDESIISEIRESIPNIIVPAIKEDKVLLEAEIDARGYVGKSYFVRYENDQLVGLEPDFSAEKEILFLAKECQSGNQPFFETITGEHETFEVHFKRLEHQVLIFIHDVTPMLHYREKLLRGNLESYQDIIATLSEGKIELFLEESALEKFLGEHLGSFEVLSAIDIPESRRFVSTIISDYSLPFQSKLLLALSEAATNTIKHSTGGCVKIFQKKEESLIQVLVTDLGSGISINEIPKTILVSGYSSKRSLGKGFLLIRKSADKTRIYTSSHGTSILMEFYYSQD
jgi:anti-sigma regulatory factor (Ser/Thr protein kinase)